MFSFFGGGHGGHPLGDGLNHGNAPISMATIPPLEILEAAYPVMFTEWSLRADSGGPGRHRGGLGAVYEIELLEEAADLFLFGERGRFGPPGVLGGAAALTNRFTYPKGGTMAEPPLASKLHDVKLTRGQRIRLETPGGGGYGPPSERAAERIADDLRLGYVTPAGARRDYGREAAE
jgi:N-methylhydantoinase B